MQHLAWNSLKGSRQVRPEKVAALRRAIQQGTYRIDPKKLSFGFAGH